MIRKTQIIVADLSITAEDLLITDSDLTIIAADLTLKGTFLTFPTLLSQLFMASFSHSPGTSLNDKQLKPPLIQKLLSAGYVGYQTITTRLKEGAEVF